MQYFVNILRVIFMLSTIVAVTDCCSSRILLLKEHTLQIVHEHSFQQFEDEVRELQQKLPQHLDLTTTIKFNATLLKSMTTASGNELPTTPNSTESTPSADETLSSIGLRNDATDSSTAQPISDDNANDFITDAAIRQQQDGNPKYHVIDYYYKIMRDVLSFQCSGIYLTDFCLNDGRCFRYPVGNHSMYACECADDYTGERCELKSVNGVYVPAPDLGIKQPKVLMARIVFSFPMLLAISFIYIVIGGVIVFKRPDKNRACYALLDVRRPIKLDSYSD